MSYTLRGRLESRLLAALLPLLATAAAVAWLHAWWPLELAALMLAVGLAADVLLWHRLLPYQPAWVALLTGAVELALVMAAARILHVAAPLRAALAIFAAAWLLGQLLAHALLPLLRLSYAEDGGELGRTGRAAALAVACVLAASAGVARATQPPTLHLAAGVHRGPIVIDRTETLVGDPGSVVRGPIVVRADDVTLRDVTVLGGEYGIVVDGAEGVTLDGVRVQGARLDGIHVRRAEVMIRDCTVSGLRSPYAQGIDISFSADKSMSMVEGCRIDGGQEGILGDFANVEVRGNHVTGTTMRAIALNEMSMGMVEENRVDGVLGIGIYCGDQSECDVQGNDIHGVRADRSSADRSRRGYGVVAFYNATATLAGNRLSDAPGGTGAFAGATLRSG